MLPIANLPRKIDFILSKNSFFPAEKIIFPGQGHFAQAMKNLEDKQLVAPIKTAIENGAKFLGICLGLQVLFDKSEEAPDVKGLGIIKGEVKKFAYFYIENASLYVAEVGYVPLPQVAYGTILGHLKKERTGSVFKGHSLIGLSINELLKLEASH